MEYLDFKKTCFYTRDYLSIPILKIKINKDEFRVKGKYNFDLENQKLRELYEKNNLTNR